MTRSPLARKRVNVYVTVFGLACEILALIAYTVLDKHNFSA